MKRFTMLPNLSPFLDPLVRRDHQVILALKAMSAQLVLAASTVPLVQWVHMASPASPVLLAMTVKMV